MNNPTPVIDEALIELLVRTFYARARRDAVLGPVFESRIKDWEPHLRTIVDFWSSIMLKSGRYGGQPMRAHVGLPIGEEHFERWLELFAQTAQDIGGSSIATQFSERAAMIAESLKLGIAVQKGEFGRTLRG